MSFERPTQSALIARAQADIDARFPGADSRLRRSALSVLARVHAGAVNGLYGMLADNARFLPDEADEARLLRWAAIKGLSPKPAVAATGTATATGANGTDILIDTVLTRADGARYVVTATATIAGGTAALALAAEDAGIDGSMDAGQLLTFLSPIAGVTATATVAVDGITGGADAESIEALRARVLLAFRSPVRGGAASDYVAWALEVTAATRAWVYENWNGLGTVKVLFVCDGRDDIIPEAGDIAAVAAWIADRRPVCAEVTVAAPVESALDFTIALTPSTPAVKAAVEAALRDLIAREAEPGGTLLLSHIREAVSGAAGETDNIVTAPAANVVAAAGAISTFGAITWA